MADITWQQVNAAKNQLKDALAKIVLTAAVDRGTVGGQAYFNALVNTAKMMPQNSCPSGQTCQTGYDDHAMYEAGTVTSVRGYPWPSNISIKQATTANGQASITFTAGSATDARADAAILYCVNNLPSTSPLLVKVSGTNDGLYQQCVNAQKAAVEEGVDVCLEESAERMEVGPNAIGAGIQQVWQAYLSMCTYLHGQKNKYQAMTDQQFSDCQSKGVSYLELRQYYDCQYSGSLENLNAAARGGGGTRELDERVRDRRCADEMKDFDSSVKNFVHVLTAERADAISYVDGLRAGKFGACPTPKP
ncbi:MAG: hypothetical protein JO253_04575 [Alphaproteobacteria bacterium]|nr:hypothetical protein [Alphaproteobacteria bacterium]